MSQLSGYRALCFDVYGTLVDWESGILTALLPTIEACNAQFSSEDVFNLYYELEREQQRKTPNLPYSKLLATVYPTLTLRLGLAAPSPDEHIKFSKSIAHWPAFPDTVEALNYLRKYYKLVVLSNVDRASFAKTNAGSLQGFQFDLVITAEDIGSYKPDLRNFEYMLVSVKSAFDINADQVLQTAQSQLHDHHPAHEVGLKFVWIERPGAIIGSAPEDIFDWRFNTLGDMADELQVCCGEVTGHGKQDLGQGFRVAVDS